MNGIQTAMRTGRQGVLRFLLLALLAVLAACTAPPGEPGLVSHAFSFDGYSDKWNEQIDLLEYSYGDRYRMVRDKVAPDRQRLRPQSGVSGPMPVGEFLYVRWRIKATNEVCEDWVDLRPLLPADMTNLELTFVIEGRQLYVYLVTSQVRNSREPQPLPTFLSRYNVTFEIYPTNTYKR